MPEQVLQSKMANALLEDVRFRARGAAGPVVRAYGRSQGGLWVGGRVTLTPQSLVFQANALNRSVQSGTLDIGVPLDRVTDVDVLPGFVTNIVAVSIPEHTLKIRCYGARRFAEAIRAARDALAEAQRRSTADDRAATVDPPDESQTSSPGA